jgi:hypothetical protein
MSNLNLTFIAATLAERGPFHKNLNNKLLNYYTREIKNTGAESSAPVNLLKEN